MSFFPLNKNTIALSSVAIITIGFFIAGLYEVLDYIIVKVLLFGGLGILMIIAITHAIKSEVKKNRLEDELQDDSH
jgi:hypothetical protein